MNLRTSNLQSFFNSQPIELVHGIIKEELPHLTFYHAEDLYTVQRTTVLCALFEHIFLCPQDRYL